MKRTQIYLPEELHKQLKHRAVEEGTSMTELVRRAVREYLQEGDKMTYIDVKNEKDAEKLSATIEEVTGVEENPHYPRVPQMDSNRWTAELNIDSVMIAEIKERLDEAGVKYEEVVE